MKIVEKIKKKIISKELNLPTKSFSFFGKIDNLNLLELSNSKGGLTFEELVVFLSICSNYSSGNFLEIGSHKGRTTINVANNFKNLKIFTFDLPPNFDLENLKFKLVKKDHELIQSYREKELYYKKYQNLSKNMTHLYGDSAEYDFTKYKNFFDLIFIDGSHKYENVISDSYKSFDMLRNNGTIVWHDYTIDHIDVVKAVNKFGKDKNIKIYRAKRTKFAIYKKEVK